MARVSVMLFVLFTVLIYVLGKENPKLSIIKRESLLAANAIRAIKIKTPQCKVQIASMATDFVVAANHALFALNNVIPNTNAEDGHDRLVSMAQLISKGTNDIQQHLPGDSEQLKGRLVFALETINKEVSKSEEEFETNSKFVRTQLGRKSDCITFEIYKLKYRATLFDKPSRDLKPEMDASVARLKESLKRSTTEDKVAEDMYRDVLQHLSEITARCVYKLENWIEVNPGRADDIKLVGQFSRTLSELFDVENRAASGNHTVDDMKTQLASIFETGMESQKGAADVNYPDNTGGQEFIRSCLIDGIVIGNAYSENIEDILGKA